MSTVISSRFENYVHDYGGVYKRHTARLSNVE